MSFFEVAQFWHKVKQQCSLTQDSGLKSDSLHFIEKIIPKAHPVEAEGAFSQGIFFDVPTKNDLKTLASVKLAPSEKDKKYSIKKEQFEFLNFSFKVKAQIIFEFPQVLHI